MCCVAKIYHVLVGHKLPDGVGYGESTDPTVKYPDGVFWFYVQSLTGIMHWQLDYLKNSIALRFILLIKLIPMILCPIFPMNNPGQKSKEIKKPHLEMGLAILF